MRIASVLFFLFCSISVLAQLTQVPIARKVNGHKLNARVFAIKDTIPQDTIPRDTIPVKLLSPIKLPFWDDFSFNNPMHLDSLAHTPNDSLWQFGRSVWVNAGMGIHPPTLNVATFDGIDSTGLPYTIANAYAKGVGDKLVSRQLRMDLVDPSDSIFIFFYYQYEGRGEPPDSGDELSLWFKSDSTWNKMWPLSGDSVIRDNSRFVPVKLTIKDPIYFHNNFQFRFQSYGRLSGPFDTWNLDYVYVSNGRKQYDTTYADFPDRAIAAPPTSPFKQYTSIPIKHFLTSKDSVTFPTFSLTNQRQDQTGLNSQPLSYTCYVTTTIKNKDKSIQTSTVRLDTAASIGNGLAYGEFRTATLKKLPDLSQLDSLVDSVAVKFDIRLDSSDNLIKYSKVIIKNRQPKTIYLNDYDSGVYKGINFQYNDTTRATFLLNDYYAYDDGTAEYAITLTQPGSYVAYEYDMFFSQPDTVVAVDVYFPHVGDESDQVIMIKVWNDLSSKQGDSILWAVQRTENNKFVRIPLDHGLLVKNKFYVGWKQNSTATIGLGFDKDSDSGSKIFYNTVGIWYPDTLDRGNMMIRPVFGNLPVTITTGVQEKAVALYPNPNRGVFYLPVSSQSIQVVDITGRPASTTEEFIRDEKQVTLTNPYLGIFLVRYYDGKQWCTQKIMVQP